MKWIRGIIIGLALVAGALVLAVGLLPGQRPLRGLIAGALADTSYKGLAGPIEPAAVQTAQVIKGESAELHGAVIETWAALDAKGQVVEVGLTLPMASVEKAPVLGATHDHSDHSDHAETRTNRRTLRYPEAVRGQTLFDTLDFYYAPTGHEPARYAEPHYDLHYFSIPLEAIQAIDCKHAPPAALVGLPGGFFDGVAPGKTFAEVCVPEMGAHAVSVREFFGRYGPFEADLLLPHYGGRVISLEPMIARAKLLKRQSFGGGLPNLSGWPGGKAVPTRFEARYHRASDSYHIVFGSFKPTGTSSAAAPATPLSRAHPRGDRSHGSSGF